VDDEELSEVHHPEDLAANAYDTSEVMH